MTYVAMGLMGLAVVSWVVGAGSFAQLVLSHRLPDRGIGWYAMHGMAALDPDSFASSGAAAHTRMLQGMGGFVVLAGLGGLIGFLTEAAA